LGWVARDVPFPWLLVGVLGHQFHFIRILDWADVPGSGAVHIRRDPWQPVVFRFGGEVFFGNGRDGVVGNHDGKVDTLEVVPAARRGRGRRSPSERSRGNERDSRGKSDSRS
jgi:hypothetical protein